MLIIFGPLPCDLDSCKFRNITMRRPFPWWYDKYILCLHIDKVQRNSPNEVINSWHSTTFCIFLGCTLNKRVFCLKDDLEFALTTIVNMACFIINFALVLDLSTSLKDWTRLENNNYLTTPFFQNLKWLEALETTIGSKNTLYIISFLASHGNTISWKEMVW